LVSLFRPFSFLKILYLPLTQISREDLSESLDLDAQLELSKEDTSHSAMLLLETVCQALGNELPSLERTILSIQLLKYNFDLAANLRRRTSRDGKSVEVDVYLTYD
jgi:hypothetical protein